MAIEDQIRQETARKSESLWLTRFSEGDANNRVAEHLGLSASTISKFKSPDQAIHLANVCEMLAFLGLRIVSAQEQTIDPDEKRYLLKVAREHITRQIEGDSSSFFSGSKP